VPRAQPAAGFTQEQFDALYRDILRDPSNRKLNLGFIDLAFQIEDYAAAIAVLDLLLFQDKDNPDLLLLSAKAYFALKSYAAARGIYETVVGLPDASEEQRAIAASMLEEIERLTRPSPWDFYAQGGIRYQTNATAGPQGIEGIQPSALPVEDWNSFVLGVLSFNQPVGEGALEAKLTTYYADQFDVQRLDLGVGELIAGPRLPIAAGDNASLSVKPYGVASGVLLGEDPYLGTYGGGVSVRARLGNPLTLEPYFEYRDRNYFNSDDYPTVSTQTGELFRYAVGGNGVLGGAISWFGRAGFDDNHARVVSDSYDEYFVDFAMRLQLGGAGSEAGPWLLTPSVTASWTEYDAAIPTDMGVVREDFEWGAGARLDVPLSQRIGLGVQVQYLKNDSNLPRFDYDNVQVTSGPTVRF
jgi:hypothetical protein